MKKVNVGIIVKVSDEKEVDQVLKTIRESDEVNHYLEANATIVVDRRKRLFGFRH